jgi:hypothetical protein
MSVAAEGERESDSRMEAMALQIRSPCPAGQAARPAGQVPCPVGQGARKAGRRCHRGFGVSFRLETSHQRSVKCFPASDHPPAEISTKGAWDGCQDLDDCVR